MSLPRSLITYPTASSVTIFTSAVPVYLMVKTNRVFNTIDFVCAWGITKELETKASEGWFTDNASVKEAIFIGNNRILKRGSWLFCCFVGEFGTRVFGVRILQKWIYV